MPDDAAPATIAEQAPSLVCDAISFGEMPLPMLRHGLQTIDGGVSAPGAWDKVAP